MKIAIIGSGGAASFAAWLLDENHTCHIFEKRNYLGGHTHSVEVKLNGRQFIVDDGAAWFSPKIYPLFNKYLELAKVEYDWIPLSLTYYDQSRNQSNCMPPIKLRNMLKMVSNPTILKQLLALNQAVKQAEALVAQKQSSQSLLDFVASLNLSAELKENFLIPLLAGVWGAPYQICGDFSIYPLMKYIVYHKPSGLKYFNWKVMRGGTKNYIATVHRQLKNVVSYTSCEIKNIQIDESTHKIQLTNPAGKSEDFDHLIITAGARDALKIVEKNVTLTYLSQILSRFEYYQARLATHSDTSLMPPNRKDWSVVNVSYNGSFSAATIWHGYNSNTDLFCSYLAPGQEVKKLHHLSEWWLPCETPAFFEAQNALKQVQGINNIWIGGDYTNDIGSHEDALISALKIVQAIDPNNSKIKAFINLQNS